MIDHMSLPVSDYRTSLAFSTRALAQYDPDYDAAYVLDPDGANVDVDVEAVCHRTG